MGQINVQKWKDSALYLLFRELNVIVHTIELVVEGGCRVCSKSHAHIIFQKCSGGSKDTRADCSISFIIRYVAVTETSDPMAVPNDWQ